MTDPVPVPDSARRFMPPSGDVTRPVSPPQPLSGTDPVIGTALDTLFGIPASGAQPPGGPPAGAPATPEAAGGSDQEIEGLFKPRAGGHGGGQGPGDGVHPGAGEEHEPGPRRRASPLAPKRHDDATSLARVGEPITQNPHVINGVTAILGGATGAMAGFVGNSVMSGLYPFFAPITGFYAALFPVSFVCRRGYLQHFKRTGNRIETPIKKMQQAWDNPDVIHDHLREVRNFTAEALGKNLFGFQRRSGNRLVDEIVDKGLLGLDPEDTREFAKLLKGRTLRQLMQVLDYVADDSTKKTPPTFLAASIGELREREVTRQEAARHTFARTIAVEELFVKWVEGQAALGAISAQDAQSYVAGIQAAAGRVDPQSIQQRILTAQKLEAGLQSKAALDPTQLQALTLQAENKLARDEYRELAAKQDPVLMRALQRDEAMLGRAMNGTLTDEDLSALRPRIVEQLKQLPPKLVEMQREGNFRKLLDAIILDFDNPLLPELNAETGETRLTFRSQLKAAIAPFRYNRFSSIIFGFLERGDQNHSMAAPFQAMCVAVKDLYVKKTLWRDTPSAFSQAQIRSLVIQELNGFWLQDEKLSSGQVRGSIQRQITWRSNPLLGAISQGISDWVLPRDAQGGLKLGRAVVNAGLTIGSPLLLNLARIWVFG